MAVEDNKRNFENDIAREREGENEMTEYQGPKSKFIWAVKSDTFQKKGVTITRLR